ncbi:Rho guanine nucleotide exchange factor 17, partial [Smittium culicis]
PPLSPKMSSFTPIPSSTSPPLSPIIPFTSSLDSSSIPLSSATDSALAPNNSSNHLTLLIPPSNTPKIPHSPSLPHFSPVNSPSFNHSASFDNLTSLNSPSTSSPSPPINRPIHPSNKSKSAEGLIPTRTLNRSYTIQQLSRKEHFSLKSSFLLKTINGSEKTISTSDNFSFIIPPSNKYFAPPQLNNTIISHIPPSFNNQNSPTSKTSQNPLKSSSNSPKNISSPQAGDPISDTRSSSLIHFHIQKESSSNLPHTNNPIPNTDSDNSSSSSSPPSLLPPNSESNNDLAPTTDPIVKPSNSDPIPHANSLPTLPSPSSTTSIPTIALSNNTCSDTTLISVSTDSSIPANPAASTPVKNIHNNSPEAMRLHAAHELVLTEKSFSDNLFLIKKMWMDPVFSSANASKPIIPYQAARTIFFGIDELFLHSQQFYNELSNEVNNYESTSSSSSPSTNKFHLNIGVLFRANTRVWHFFVSYVENYGKAIELLNQLSDYKPFTKYQAKVISLKESGRQSLKDLLMLPIQRVMRYSLLLKTLVKYTPINNRDHIELCRAVKIANQLASVVNEARRIQEENLVTNELFKSIENCPAIPPNNKRVFVFEHVVLELVSRQKTRIVVFNDYLIVARSNSSKSSGSSIGLGNSGYGTESSPLENINSNINSFPQNSISNSNNSNSNNNTINNINFNSTTNSNQLNASNSSSLNFSNSNSYNESKEAWVFYSYAPLNQAEVQNADENADTLVTVLALNRYKPPTNTRRRSVSVTSLIDPKNEISSNLELPARNSDSNDLSQNDNNHSTNNHDSPNLKAPSGDYSLSGNEIKRPFVKSNTAPKNSVNKEPTTLNSNKLFNTNNPSAILNKNVAINNKYDSQTLTGRPSNTFGNAFNSGLEISSFTPPPPLRTHVIVLQHSSSSNRRSFVKNLRISKENYINSSSTSQNNSIFSSNNPDSHLFNTHRANHLFGNGNNNNNSGLIDFLSSSSLSTTPSLLNKDSYPASIYSKMSIDNNSYKFAYDNEYDDSSASTASSESDDYSDSEYTGSISTNSDASDNNFQYHNNNYSNTFNHPEPKFNSNKNFSRQQGNDYNT